HVISHPGHCVFLLGDIRPGRPPLSVWFPPHLLSLALAPDHTCDEPVYTKGIET
ncbi:hypothetical protein M9458_012221, partial [Cirrhinus mrigala]